MHPRLLHISDYSYSLPEERIARYPLPGRDSSKLLIYQNGNIAESVFRHITDYLPANAHLIFNNTRVIPARLWFENANGGRVEIFCLEPAERRVAMSLAMNQTGSIRWKCLIGRASKWKEKVLVKKTEDLTLTAEVSDRTPDIFIVTLRWTPEQLTFAEVLDKIGIVPIPPYLHRAAEEVDTMRYQTVYAKQNGSVAAPTAGLHFTKTVFAALKAKGITTDELTLHVGAGTFKPVKSETMEGHEMHTEVMEVERRTIEQLLEAKAAKRPIISVGTTSLRTLESLYWMGVKAAESNSTQQQDLAVAQWDPYQMLGREDALEQLLAWMKQNEQEKVVCRTQIIIAPPYRPQVIDGLITNFHQPHSTLLLLVAAVVGADWKAIYDYALTHQFRFLSYGDSSLLFMKR